MYQDGKGEDTSLPALEYPADKGPDNRRSMALTLIGADGSSSQWELVPLAKSYQEAIQMAQIMFHKVLDDGIDASDLFIKYHFKRLDGTLVWAGLTATKDSAVNWNHIMDSMGVNVPEIGVFVGNPSRGIMRFYNSVSSTFSEDRVPSTYETCLKQACEVERGLTDSARSGKHTMLIWSPKPVASWVVLPPSDYRGAVKRYTFKFAQENKTGPKVDAVAVKLQLAQ